MQNILLCEYNNVFNQLPFEKTLAIFQSFAITNSAAVNILVNNSWNMDAAVYVEYKLTELKLGQ